LSEAEACNREASSCLRQGNAGAIRNEAETIPHVIDPVGAILDLTTIVPLTIEPDLKSMAQLIAGLLLLWRNLPEAAMGMIDQARSGFDHSKTRRGTTLCESLLERVQAGNIETGVAVPSLAIQLMLDLSWYVGLRRLYDVAETLARVAQEVAEASRLTALHCQTSVELAGIRFLRRNWRYPEHEIKESIEVLCSTRDFSALREAFARVAGALLKAPEFVSHLEDSGPLITCAANELAVDQLSALLQKGAAIFRERKDAFCGLGHRNVAALAWEYECIARLLSGEKPEAVKQLFGSLQTYCSDNGLPGPTMFGRLLETQQA